MVWKCVLRMSAQILKRSIYCRNNYNNGLKNLSPFLTSCCSSFASSSNSNFLPHDLDAEDDDQPYEKLAQESGLVRPKTASGSKENLLVIYPRIRWGKNSIPKNTTHELLLEEAIALVKTLPWFNVVSSIMVGTDESVRKKFIWGKGRIEELLLIKSTMNVTAIFIDIDMLSPAQQAGLHWIFKVPIYDRYNIVLAIFKHFAKTKEAHLQIALAEIPYIKQRLGFVNRYKRTPVEVLHLDDIELFSGSKADQFEILRQREQFLTKQIGHAIKSREKELDALRPCRDLTKTCLIAVVGYTNAGKTTLITKLAEAKDLHGEDRLFATLDTSVHTTVLPSKNRVLVADTIGFISNLPIRLFASFSATLSHVDRADIIVHVIDVSHPNMVQQRIEVLETLRNLKIDPSTHRIIEVGNKTDRVSNLHEVYEKFESAKQIDLPIPEPNLQMISCQNGEGLVELIRLLDAHVMEITQSRLRRIHLRMNSTGIEYLYKNKLVGKQPVASECGNFLVFDVVMNDGQMAKFQSFLGKELKLEKSNA